MRIPCRKEAYPCAACPALSRGAGFSAEGERVKTIQNEHSFLGAAAGSALPLRSPQATNADPRVEDLASSLTTELERACYTDISGGCPPLVRPPSFDPSSLPRREQSSACRATAQLTNPGFALHDYTTTRLHIESIYCLLFTHSPQRRPAV